MTLPRAVGSAFLMLGLYFATMHGVAQTLDGQVLREARDNLNRGVKSFSEQKYAEVAQKALALKLKEREEAGRPRN